MTDGRWRSTKPTWWAGFMKRPSTARGFPTRCGQLGAFADGVGGVLLVWDKQGVEPAPARQPPATRARDAAEAYRDHYAALDPYRTGDRRAAGGWLGSTCRAFFERSVRRAQRVYLQRVSDPPRHPLHEAPPGCWRATASTSIWASHRAPRQAPFTHTELQAPRAHRAASRARPPAPFSTSRTPGSATPRGWARSNQIVKPTLLVRRRWSGALRQPDGRGGAAREHRHRQQPRPPGRAAARRHRAHAGFDRARAARHQGPAARPASAPRPARQRSSR